MTGPNWARNSEGYEFIFQAAVNYLQDVAGDKYDVTQEPIALDER
jgi:hypothetical protein